MNILTFDIESWFHILDHASTKTESNWNNYTSRIHENVDRILDLLNAIGHTATFFCLGWIGKHYPEVVRKIADAGHEIGTHSHMHQLAFEQTPDEFRQDLTTSIDILTGITGKAIRSYRAPGFSLKKQNAWVFEELLAAGIEADCSIFPASRAHGGFPDFGNSFPALVRTHSGVIKEYPINVVKIFGKAMVFSGGGYFRLIPYPLLHSLMRRSSYVMTYFHPRDFDVGQPTIKDLSALRKWKSYCGLKGSEKKLCRLMSNFEFMSLGQADQQINWSAASEVDLRASQRVRA